MKKLPLAGLMLLVLSSLAIAHDAKAQTVELISVSAPVYPKEHILPGVEGRVEFQGTITSAGLVEDIKVLVSSGFPPLDKAAEDSLKTARFKPLVDKEGKPTSKTVRLPIDVHQSPTSVDRPCLWFNNELTEFARFNPTLGVNDLKSIQVIRGAYISGLFGGEPAGMTGRILSAGRLMDETLQQCKATPDITVLAVLRAAVKKYGN